MSTLTTNELQQFIQMDKDVITQVIHFIQNTTKVNGYNEGQLKEGKNEIERLTHNILEKSRQIGGSFESDQKIYVATIRDIISDL